MSTILDNIEITVEHNGQNFIDVVNMAIKALQDAKRGYQKHGTVNGLGVLQMIGPQIDAKAGALAQAIEIRDMVKAEESN